MRPRAQILICDDQPEILDAIKLVCSSEGMQCSTVNSPDAVLPKLAEEEFDLLLMDMNYHQDRTGGQEGLNLLRSVHQSDPSLPIVVMTAWVSIPLAVQAVQLGAKDFLQKPWENERLLSIVRNQIELRAALKGKERLEAENSVLRSAQAPSDEFVALSSGMQEVKRIIEQVAPSDANVLITGENGTGKGVVARLLHQLSGRSQQPVISVNMGGIPETLFESEMFGHVKGAFTDARADRTGRFDLADGGTLFLAEIANVPLNLQAKLLRVLETGELERVGSSTTRRVDVRVLAATNVDVNSEAAAGRFRQDLLFRLNTIEIFIPPLRERREDIDLLAHHFVHGYSQRYRKNIAGFDSAATAALHEHLWPGNVRELDHAVERGVLLSAGPLVRAVDLGLRAQASTAAARLEEMPLDEVERHLIRRTLARHDGNVSQAAKALGLSRSALYRRLQKHELG